MDVFNAIIADPLCGGLVRTTIFLSVGFCLVEGFLGLFRVTSPRIHQFCWLAVLLLGWVWVRPTLDFSATQNFVASTEATQLVSSEPSLSSYPAYYKQVTLVVLFVWTVGICAVLLRALRNYRQLCRHLSETVEPSAPWKEQWERTLKYENLDQPVPLRISTQIGPTLVRKYNGYEIVVPMELWKTLEPRERLCLLRLQLSHLRNRDVWKFFLVRLLVLPHWFNPLSWIALHRFERSVDFASDERVYQETSESPTRLRDTLLHLQEYTNYLAERYTKEQQFALGRDFEKESKNLAERIRRLESLQEVTFVADSPLKKTGVVGLLTMMFLALIVQIESNETRADAENDPAPVPRPRIIHSRVTQHSEQLHSEQLPNPKITANAAANTNTSANLDINIFDLATEFTSTKMPGESDLTSQTPSVQQGRGTIEQVRGSITVPSIEFSDFDNSPYESEEPFAKRFPDARTPYASQLIRPDARPLVILDDQGNEVKNQTLTLLQERFSSSHREGDNLRTMEMIHTVADHRTRFTLLIEFCDQLAYQVKNAYNEHQLNEEELFRKVDQIGDILGTASQTAKELKPDSVRDDAYVALAERNAHYIGDFTTAEETLLKVKSSQLRSNKLTELAELPKANDTSLNAAINKGETPISTSENTPLIR